MHSIYADRMELEAAEALAGLAQVATTTTTRESSESGTTKWGSKGKRARGGGGQVKSESLHVDSPDLALTPSNYQVAIECDQIEETSIHEGFKKAKIKQQAKLLSPSLTCDASTSMFGCSRSRKNLTEAEKEEKRIRRVLANRESARQTIRRRQALHEDLCRKASDLSMENVGLKREKKLALEKLRSLKSANERLKTRMSQNVNPVREENFLQGVQNVNPKDDDNLLQMSLNIKSEVDENLDLKLAHPDVSSSKNTSKAYCNISMEHSQLTPSMPPIVQHLNLDQSAPMPCIPMLASGFNSSDVKPYNVNSPLTPVYILPYPWFVPVPYNRDGDVHQDSKAAENGHNNAITGSASSNSGTVENYHSTLTLQAKGSKENGPGTSSNRTPFLHMIDGHGTGVVGGHPTGSAPTLSAKTSPDHAYVVSNGEHEPWFIQESSQLGCSGLYSAPQMKKESAFFFPVKVTEHSAAAEARKRRKELTRFKNFTGHQYRLPC